MKRVLIVFFIATIAAISCSKSESPKQTCWSCNLQDPLSGLVDHVDTCLNGTEKPLIIERNGTTFSAACTQQ